MATLILLILDGCSFEGSVVTGLIISYLKLLIKTTASLDISRISAKIFIKCGEIKTALA